MRQKILPEERRPMLKKLLNKHRAIRVIEAHSGISGLLGESTRINVGGHEREFHALWISSLTDSVTKGYPDEEIVSIDSRLNTVNQVMNVTTKPLIYDGDTGGFPEQLNYLVKQLECLGVSGVMIEDKRYPKINSLLLAAHHRMESIEEFVKKIKCTKTSQKSEDFMLIARIESLIAGEEQEKAVERAQAYLEAGADAIMIHSKNPQPDEVIGFADHYHKLYFPYGRKPLMCVPTTYHGISEKELEEHGFNIILYANHLLRASFLAMKKVCHSLLEHGRAEEAEAMCATLKDVLEPVDSTRTYSAEYEN